MAEWALANVSPYSFYHYWSFPRTAKHYFEKYALFQDAPENVVTEWKEAYKTLLQSVTFRSGGRRLLLKNPVNTGRIALLLDLFPGAKFIHIYRNPYTVFSSTLHFHKKMLALIYLQEVGESQIETDVLRFYRAIMQKFWTEKALIPAGNLVEVKFEDLEADPLAEVRRIYRTLRLPGFEAAESRFRAYICSQGGYQKNSFPSNDEIIRKVDLHWNFALKAWGYPAQTT
jgi:hypothetical protein